MKLITFFSGMLLSVSCSAGSSIQSDITEKTFTICSSPYTRTSLAEDLNVFWTLGDKVSVFGKGMPERHQKFKVTEADGRSATIQGKVIPNDTYFAIYPFNEANSCSGKGLTFVIPQRQQPVAGTFSENLNPAYSVSQKEVFEFRNAGASLRFTMPSDGVENFTKATLSGTGAESLAGTFTVNPDNGSVVAEESVSEVLLDGKIEAGKTYTFVTAPVTFPEGLSIAFDMEEGGKYSFRTEGPIEVEAGQVKDLGVLQLVSDGDTYPGATKIGRSLFLTEGIMSEFLTDASWTVTDGLVATEVAFRKSDGLETRTFFFEVDLNNPAITISQTTPDNKPIGEALQSVTRQALLAEAGNPDMKIWDGTNSDFFDMKNGTNLPHGIFQHEGKVYKNYFNPKIKRKMSFFYLTKDKKAGIGLEKEYNEVSFSTDILEACGGGELLVDKGQVLDNPQPLEPRTCIGISEDGKTVYIMVADGRSAGYSNGMTLNEIAQCMKAVGAWKSINLDGGGSSTFYVRDLEKSDKDPTRFEVRNRPSDGRERGVATGLVIISASSRQMDG